MDYLTADDLETMTGIPASTWRYFAHAGKGPQSLKIGRRRVWRREAALAWLAEQELAATRD